MDYASLNYLAILVAAIAAFFIGFLWHGPVFGKQWMKLMKIGPQEMEQGKKEMEGKMPVYLLVALLQQLVTAFTLAMFVQLITITDTVGALTLAFWVWLGFIAAVLLNGVLWEKRTISLYLFNVVYHLVILVVMSLIVVLWQ